MPSYHQSRFSRLVKKYLKGTSTVAEKNFLIKYYDYFNKEKNILDELSDEKKESLMLEMNDHIYQFAANMPRARIRYLFPWSIAAALLIMIGGGIWQKDRLINLLYPVIIQHQMTKLGERKEFRLEDGTHIWLAPGSHLTYPNYFRGKTREVNLDGEAFFEVAKDHQHPFIIHNGKLDTRVVGTSFNIKAYQTEKNISVSVLTGKVSVTETGKFNQVLLILNQRALYDKASASLTKEDFPNASQLLDRRNGLMEYKETPLADVMNDLSRQYNVKIKFIEHGKACLFNGGFNSGNDFNGVLKQISLAINITLKKDKETYVIIDHGCN